MWAHKSLVGKHWNVFKNPTNWIENNLIINWGKINWTFNWKKLPDAFLFRAWVFEEESCLPQSKFGRFPGPGQWTSWWSDCTRQTWECIHHKSQSLSTFHLRQKYTRDNSIMTLGQIIQLKKKWFKKFDIRFFILVPNRVELG